MAGKIPSRTNRAHNAKPYDRPKNFLQKVASTLCDMFVPSWMLHDSSQKNNSSQKPEHGEELPSQSVLQSDLNQPLPESSYIPERRPCCSSYAAVDLKERREKAKDYELSSGQRTESTEENVHSSAKPDILSSSYGFQRKSSIRHPVVNGDDHSENSEGSASTSGCSSLVSSHQERKDQIHDPGLQISEEEGNLSTRHTPLWSEDRSLNPSKRARPQPSATGRRPSFSLSSFGAPPLSDSRNSTNKCCSPFYEGKTVFGGAASNRRMQLLSPTPYQYTRPRNARLNVKEAGSSKKEFDYMSTTAKRILRSLEKMSSPLEDAKKIPADGKTMDLAFAARHRVMPSVMALKRQNIKQSERGPPTTGVLLPSRTVIGKNLEPRISPSTEKKKTSDATVTENSSVNTFTAQPSSTPAGGKLKTRIHSSMHHSRKQDSDEVMELPDLPSVPLPVTQLPTFNFNHLSKSTTKSTAASSGSSSMQPVFTFSSPVEHKVPSSSQIPCSSEAPFTFSTPVIKDKITESTKKSQNATYSSKEDQCHSEQSSDIIVGGSVMDVLEKPESRETTPPSVAKSSNDKSTEETNKIEQQEVKTDAKQDKSISGFGDRFKPKPGSWECSTCLVRNEEKANECISCTSPRPNVKSSNTVTSETPSFKGFGDKFKPPADSWNCPSCMINNSNSSQQCIACETAKPQSTKLPLVPQVPSVSFGVKFKSTGSWHCDTCFSPNSNDTTKCAACETPALAVSQIKDPKQAFSGFKFNIPEKKSADASGTEVKFGMPESSVENVSEAITTGGFKFGETTTASKSSESLNFGMPASGQNVPSSVCLFGDKPLDKISEPVSTSAKVETGFSIPVNNNSSSSFSFGQNTLSVSTPEKTNFKFGVEPTPQQLKTTKEETTPVSNSVLLSSTVPLPSVTSSAPLSTKPSSSLTTVTTTVSVFSPGKSPPVMSTTSSNEITPSNSANESTTTLPKQSSNAFSFTSATPRADSSTSEVAARPLGSLQGTSEDAKLPIFGTAKPAIGLKPDVGQSVKSEIEQKPIIAQSTSSSATSSMQFIAQSTSSSATSSMQFSFGTNTKNSSGFVFGTPKTEPSQGTAGGFTFAIGSGKQASEKPGFGSFCTGGITQPATASTFSFGSGGLVSNVTTTAAATTTTSRFTFGAFSSQPVASAKPENTAPTTNAPLFSSSPQISPPSFGSALSTPTFGQQSQVKQEAFVFQQSSPGLRFGGTTTAPAPLFRFGALQEQKPAGFTFGASQEPEQQKPIEITPTVPQDGGFMFGSSSSQGSEQEKPKTGFHFPVTPPQQTPVFGTGLSLVQTTTTITGTAPTFNFTGNAPSAAAFSFPASPSNTPSSATSVSRKIKRAVRRSGRRD